MYKKKKVTILGATGKREDHTIGNIALANSFINEIEIQVLTDYGVFVPQTKTTTFESFPKQQVSIFSFTPEITISSTYLLYPLINNQLQHWWEGTLNEATRNQFTIEINYSSFYKQEQRAPLTVFREYFSKIKK